MMKKILNLFGLYTESDVLKAIVRVQNNHRPFQREVANRLQKNFFKTDTMDKHLEISHIATIIHSYNPFIDIILELREPNSTTERTYKEYYGKK